ncbi:unnamed protein product [Ostreobium quekettii]|uniref:NYN domain-containing protein n=1 Tax=Ostreobium quekettii TaxID=121088 RepID=A0A8S1IR24_9CHLO|nr:unnamed protein product [Ostreobium quekettii]|eukprot:evm.model.scf_81.9 EVM.evm.TU.scf_81.9   scf_81:93870-95044(-)
MMEHDRWRFQQLDLEARRQVLEDEVIVFSQHRGVRVKIVYDAAGSQTAPPDGTGFNREEKSGIELVFCTTVEADIGLIIEAAKSLGKGTPYVVIATSDRAVQERCKGPWMHAISSEVLLQEINGCARRLRAMLRGSQTQHVNGKRAGPLSANPDLKKLRDQLQ